VAGWSDGKRGIGSNRVAILFAVTEQVAGNPRWQDDTFVRCRVGSTVRWDAGDGATRSVGNELRCDQVRSDRAALRYCHVPKPDAAIVLRSNGADWQPTGLEPAGLPPCYAGNWRSAREGRDLFWSCRKLYP
jgi:hypothetical protein